MSFAINLCVKETSLKQTLDYSHHNATLPPGATVSDEADNSRAVVSNNRTVEHSNSIFLSLASLQDGYDSYQPILAVF